MNPLQVLKTSSRVTLINGVGSCLNFLAAVFVANHLGPELYGRIGFVLLSVTYAGLIRPGFFEGGQRQLIDQLGKANLEGSRRVQNVGVTGEFIWSLLPAVVLASASVGSSDHIRHLGFLLAPLMYLGLTTTRIMGGLFLAHRDFRVYLTACLCRAVTQPSLLIVLVYFVGPYTLIATPAIVECGIAMFYLSRSARIGVAWRMEKATAFHLLRIGFPLSLAAIVYWAYHLAGPTCVAEWLPVATFGSYMFASKVIDLILRFFADFAGILMPGLWRELGSAGGAHAMWQEISGISLFLGLLSCFICNLIQAGIALPVLLLLPRFSSSVPIFEILAFNIVLLTVTTAPCLLLDSAVINRQWLHVGIWTIGLILNYIINYAALRSGYGTSAIAWNDIWLQVVVALVIYAAAHRYLFPDRASAQQLYFPLLGLLLICGCTFLILGRPFFSVGAQVSHGEQVLVSVCRAAFVLAVWTPVTLFLHRRYGQVLRPNV